MDTCKVNLCQLHPIHLGKFENYYGSEIDSGSSFSALRWLLTLMLALAWEFPTTAKLFPVWAGLRMRLDRV